MMKIYLTLSLLLLISTVAADQNKNQFKVLSAEFGGISYEGTESGVFKIVPIKAVDENTSYFAWIVVITCPKDGEWLNWKEITYLPGPYPGGKAGVSEDDPSVTLANDLKSFTTSRTTECRKGTARIDDLYGREEQDQIGKHRIEVWLNKTRLAEFKFEVTGKHTPDYY